jgi:hypothetical protein
MPNMAISQRSFYSCGEPWLQFSFKTPTLFLEAHGIPSIGAARSEFPLMGNSTVPVISDSEQGMPLDC